MKKRMDTLERERKIDYFREKSLDAIIHMPSYRWEDVIIKELIDNSLDELDLKNDGKRIINITAEYDRFAISDNGRGFSEELLDRIYDFDKYVSSKLYRGISRGMLGNALMTIIGICYLRKYQLYFVTANGKKIIYVPNRAKIDMGILENAFEKAIEDTDWQKGIYIFGEWKRRPSVRVDEFLHLYRIVNPDVAFTLNGDEYPPYKMDLRKFKDTHSIHWYDLQSFVELVTNYKDKHPNITTKKLVADLFNAHNPLSDYNIPKYIGKIKLDEDWHVILENLYNSLKKDLKIVSPEFLNKYAIGRKMAKSIYGENLLKYNCEQGTYEKDGAQIPFFIEAVLVAMEGENSIATAINNTVAYDSCPLNFDVDNLTFDRKFLDHKPPWYCSSLKDLINETKFREGNGHKLLIQLITPYLEFYDQSKAKVNVEKMKEAIIKVIQPAVIYALKAMKKASRSEISNQSGVGKKKRSKISLMHEYAMEGAREATGDWEYSTTARQVFYAVRRLIITNHDITLNNADSDRFTQDVLTELFEDHPDLENKISFEQRGVYVDPEDGEMPISTQNVNNLLDRVNNITECKLSVNAGEYSPCSLMIDYPIELGTSAVLFIEKQGFKEALEKSGIADELGLKLILSQGYSTRNIKRIIEGFRSRGVEVYVLHDYDFDGINIKNRIIEGSKTYKKPLDVIDIGLSYGDIVEYKKLIDAETYESKKSYARIFESMSKEEQDFLWPERKTKKDKNGKTIYIYRRVELNAFTMPELLSLIRSKITNKKPKPSLEQIRHLVSFDNDTIDNLKKDLITEILLEQVQERILRMDDDGIALDKEAILEECVRAIHNGRSDDKWQNVIKSIIRRHTEDIKNKMRGIIKV